MRDQKILNLLTSRDQDFLEKLFNEVNPYLLRILGSQKIFGETAQDLVQAAWEKFFENLDKFEGRSQIKVFVAGILFNKIREYRRAIKRTEYFENADEVFNSAFTPDGWWNQEPDDPSRLMQMRDTSQAIEDCMQGLTAAQAEAFVLREIEGEQTEQICKILGINVSHLGVLLFRAKDKLRKCLEGKLG